ncbi:hypothetical protein D3C71_1542520 [compost metagenome]
MSRSVTTLRYWRRRSALGALPSTKSSKLRLPGPVSDRSWPHKKNSIACQPVAMFSSPPRSFWTDRFFLLMTNLRLFTSPLLGLPSTLSTNDSSMGQALMRPSGPLSLSTGPP